MLQEEGSVQRLPPPGPQLSGGRPAACAPFPIPGSRRCWPDSRKQAGPRVTRSAPRRGRRAAGLLLLFREETVLYP